MNKLIVNFKQCKSIRVQSSTVVNTKHKYLVIQQNLTAIGKMKMSLHTNLGS